MFFTLIRFSREIIRDFQQTHLTLTLKSRYKTFYLRLLLIFIEIFSPKFFFIERKKNSTTAPTTTEQKASNERCGCRWKHYRWKKIHSLDSEKNSEVSSEKVFNIWSSFVKRLMSHVRYRWD